MADGNILTVILIVVIVVLLFWLCAGSTREGMSKEKSMKMEIKHMADSLKKMAHERRDQIAGDLSHKLKKAVHKMKHKMPRHMEVKLAHKIKHVADALKQKMNESEVAEELKAMAECLEDMAEDLMTKKDASKEGYRYYHGGYYRPYWRYWRYYRPYRFYRPYYYYGGYW